MSVVVEQWLSGSQLPQVVDVTTGKSRFLRPSKWWTGSQRKPCIF